MLVNLYIFQLVEVSGARVTVSNITDVYPGTSERIVLISGNWTCVNSAQSLLWEMLGSNSQSNGIVNSILIVLLLMFSWKILILTMAIALLYLLTSYPYLCVTRRQNDCVVSTCCTGGTR